MGKNKLSSGLINVISYDTESNILLNSGSTTLMSLSGSGVVTIPGSLIVSGGISGSSAESASYAVNADKIDNLDSSQLVLTSSFNSYTSSASSSIGDLSGSVATTTFDISSSVTSLSSSIATTTSGLAGRITTVEGNYVTTGSNIFVGNQSITGSICSTGDIVTTGQIVAQTINVQQVTSSIVYSCGSNIFGNSLSNTQQFTGSLQVTGSNHYLFGNVGLGTDTPSGKLSISAVGADGIVLSPDLSDANNSARIFFIRTGGEGWSLMNNGGILSVRSGAIPGTTSGVQKLGITTDGVAIYSCQVCTPHLVASNNISIGSSCTSTSGYNTRLRITNIANDTFVFAFNNLSCKPIMQMYGGNTNNPQGYTSWLDNTSDNLNHLISHNTSEATYFASQGGNVGIGTSTLVTTCTNGALTIVKRHNLDTAPSVTAQCYYCNQSGLYIFGRNSGISLISSTNEESRIQFASPSSEWFAAIGATTLNSAVGGTLYFRTGASNSNRFYIDNTGISYFSCQVCAPFISVGDGIQCNASDAPLTIKRGIAFAGLDFKSLRTEGNIGGARFYDSLDTLKSQFLVEVDGSYNFYNATSINRFKITSTGIACFACQVCIGGELFVNGGSITVNCTNTTATDARINLYTRSSTNGDRASIYGYNLGGTTSNCEITYLAFGYCCTNNQGYTNIQTKSGGSWCDTMTIINGNVGVGTRTPSGLGRAFVVSSSGYPDIIVEKTGSNARKWGMTVGSDGSYLLRDYTDGNNRLTISNTGSVGINGTLSVTDGTQIRIGSLPEQYPYRRIDSYEHDGSGYFWGFGVKYGAVQKINAFFVGQARTFHAVDDLKVVSWVSNEFNGSYPSYSVPINLHATSTSYINTGAQFIIGRTSFCNSFSFANTETANGATWLGPLSLGNSGGGNEPSPLYCGGGKRWSIGWNSGDMNALINYNNCTPFLLAWGINGDNPPADRKFCFNYDGNAYASGGTWGTLSSNCVIKTCITGASSQWNDVKNICIVNYKMKEEIEEFGAGARIHLGVVAEQVESVSPGLLENSGYSQKWCTCLNGVKTSILYMKAVKALQEAMCRIEILESCLGV